MILYVRIIALDVSFHGDLAFRDAFVTFLDVIRVCRDVVMYPDVSVTFHPVAYRFVTFSEVSFREFCGLFTPWRFVSFS